MLPKPEISLLALFLFASSIAMATAPPNRAQSKESRGSIKGYVFDLEAKTGAANVTVTLGELKAICDLNGFFEFSGLAPGQYALSINKTSLPDDRMVVQETPIMLTLKENQQKSIEFDLVRSASLTGTIQIFQPTSDSLQSSELAEGLAGLTIELSNSLISVVRVSDARGHFEFAEIPPGRWTLRTPNESLPLNLYFEDESVDLELSPGEARAILMRVLPRQTTFLVQKETIGDTEETSNSGRNENRNPDPDPVSSAQTNEVEYYTVLPGDWLSKIAAKFYGDPMRYDEIFNANRDIVRNPDLIYPGQRLRIPVEPSGEDYYTVRPGDWLSKISVRTYGYTTAFTQIFEANMEVIRNPELIYPGQRIKLPLLEQDTVYYTVQPGDWLSKIARMYYGDHTKYIEIFGANIDALEDPNFLEPGQRLKIPPLVSN